MIFVNVQTDRAEIDRCLCFQQTTSIFYLKEEKYLQSGEGAEGEDCQGTDMLDANQPFVPDKTAER